MKAMWMLAAAGLVVMSARAEEKMVPLQTKLPKPMYQGTGIPVKLPNLEPLKEGRPADFLAPADVVNLAAGKPVTGSDEAPIIGSLDMITDGDKEAADGSFVEFAPGTQYVQIDLGAPGEIWAVWVWHYHQQSRAYHDVIVQVADDADFVRNVRTLFNNDHDNSSGKGVGKDFAYVESNKGRLIDGKKEKARFVRLYSKGSTDGDVNHYIEVEVYGRPAKP